MKTLEQSVMEVEEEHELSAMTSFKGAWYERPGGEASVSEEVCAALRYCAPFLGRRA